MVYLLGAGHHLHPEAKFDHADYMDSGLTARKHVIVTSTEHIGKEANRWEEQWYLGLDKDAQIIYGMSPKELEAQWNAFMNECQNYSLHKIAKASELDVALVSRLITGKVKPTRQTLMKLQDGIISLNRESESKVEKTQAIINAVKEHCQHISVRQFAESVGRSCQYECVKSSLGISLQSLFLWLNSPYSSL